MMSGANLRRGIYFIADTGAGERERLAPITEAALRGGVTLVQLRAKHLPPAEVAELGRELLSVTRQFGVPLLINDLPQVAAETGAEGVHLGQEDTSVAEARRLLGPAAIIGATTDNAEQVRRAEAEGADYIALGAVFRSPTKPDADLMPPGTVRELAALASVPVCVIGGINEGNIGELAPLRPDLVCVISAIALADDPEAATRRLRQAMERWG